MPGNSHRANCANAQNPGCECSGCGGSLHGWQGWVALAEDTQQVRDARRRELVGRIGTDHRGDLRLNAANRQTCIDLVRVDLADFMSATRPHEGSQSLSLSWPDRAGAASGSDRVSLLGEAIMDKTWNDISTEIDSLLQDERRARDVKRQLANHAWCSLLVALIRWIEQIDKAIQSVADRGKQFIKEVLTEHLTGLPRTLADAVVGIVVGRVWAALEKLVEAHFPLLGGGTLRALRMLAVFTCPSVERHPEVYKHAARPLLGDGQKLVSDQVKAQVVTLFTAWWNKREPDALA